MEKEKAIHIHIHPYPSIAECVGWKCKKFCIVLYSTGLNREVCAFRDFRKLTKAEDFRLVHMRTRHFHGKDAFSTKKKEEASEESESSESDSDTTDLVRLLSSAGDDSDSDNSTNTTDDSDTAPKIEELTLDLTLNGVIPTCKISGGCGLNLTDDKTPFVEHVTPLNGSFDDGTTVVITVAMSSEPQDVQVFFGPFECPGAVVTSPKSGRWTVTVQLCAFEASITPVYVLTSTGYAVAGSPFTGASFQFEQFLKLKSITPSSGSFYGGSLVTIEGAGLGPTAAMNYATVGGYPCEVISASNTQIQCYTPAAAAELATENSTVRTFFFWRGGKERSHFQQENMRESRDN